MKFFKITLLIGFTIQTMLLGYILLVPLSEFIQMHGLNAFAFWMFLAGTACKTFGIFEKQKSSSLTLDWSPKKPESEEEAVISEIQRIWEPVVSEPVKEEVRETAPKEVTEEKPKKWEDLIVNVLLDNQRKAMTIMDIANYIVQNYPELDNGKPMNLKNPLYTKVYYTAAKMIDKRGILGRYRSEQHEAPATHLYYLKNSVPAQSSENADKPKESTQKRVKAVLRDAFPKRLSVREIEAELDRRWPEDVPITEKEKFNRNCSIHTFLKKSSEMENRSIHRFLTQGKGKGGKYKYAMVRTK